MHDSSLSKEEKEINISILKSLSLPENYFSPAWLVINNSVNTVKDAQKVISKPWLIGFTEAEGRFYIVKKENTLASPHVFEIRLRSDKIVLEAISFIFSISEAVINNKTYFTVFTTNTESIKNIINYYFKTMKGIKSLEYRIWARSFNKKKDFFKLSKIQNLMRNIKSINASSERGGINNSSKGK